jgi:hypothetical protein
MILDEIQKKYSKEIEKLREDEFYYGDFGRQYLSNSDIGSLLNNPKNDSYVIGQVFSHRLTRAAKA